MIHEGSIRAREIFAEAAAMPQGERADYLRSACAGDVEVRDHVTALLAAHDRGSEFLADATLDTGRLLGAAPAPAESPGDVLGPYKLLQLIGEGGFGAVYLAEQQHPVRRRVALKVIKLGMDTRQVVARFEAERQALALMEHPNIAKVLDAGATDAGRPYFVMEYVAGVPVTEYCDSANLTTRDRLEIFIPVCRAVQHAHQKGVIHRDLKPNNVLVTLHDGAPVPKVIDFGIAKVVDGRLTERTLFTEHRQIVGTPQYMSPEQAWTSGLDVDTRSDVYSLGVILYELLTGTTPFPGDELRGRGYAEIQRIIREVEPQPPSTRLSTLGATLSDVAARRRTEPRRLGQLVRGELDWVALRCLEKDRTRRYDSAGDLADDVQRFLRNEVVRARPPGWGYTVRKTLRRHRVALSAGAAVATAIVLGLCVAIAGLVHANRQRFAAEQARGAEAEQRAAAVTARDRAERAREQAVAVNALLHQLFVSVNRRRTGDEASMRKALDDAAAKVDAGSLAEEPDVEAAVRSTLGNAYASWGIYREAERHLRAALEMHRRTAPGGGDLDVANGLNDLGWLLERTGRHEAAESMLREALGMRRRLLGGQDPAVADTMHALAMVLLGRGEVPQSHALVRQSLSIRIANLDAALAHAPHDAGLLSRRAHARARAGDFSGAVTDYGAAVAADPQDHWNWYLQGIIHLYLGDNAHYREVRRQMLERFAGDAAPEVVERAAKLCLLDPTCTDADAQEVTTLVERAVASNAPPFMSWFLITKGMHEYRLGRSDSAITYLRRGRLRMNAPAGRALADFYLAMSFHRSGNHEFAQQAMANAVRATPEDAIDLSGIDPLDGGSAICNWLVTRVAQREAEQLLGAGAAGPQLPAARETSGPEPTTRPAGAPAPPSHPDL
jgi:serine/threonine protein kinase/tetratricopeptide (TPR) repeat protein